MACTGTALLITLIIGVISMCLFDLSNSKDFVVSYHFTIKAPVTSHKLSILVNAFVGLLDYLAFVLSLVLV